MAETGFLSLFSGLSNTEQLTDKKSGLVNVGDTAFTISDARNLSRTNQVTNTDSRSWNMQTSEVYNPIDNRSLTLVLNSAGATAETKKDIATTSNPQFTSTPSTSIVPKVDLTQTSEAISSFAKTMPIGQYALYGALAVGGYYVLKKTPIGKKLLGGKKNDKK